MHSIGKNRFFWPMIDDVLWYKAEHFVTIIEPPRKVTNIHFEIEKEMWSKIECYLDL